MTFTAPQQDFQDNRQSLSATLEGVIDAIDGQRITLDDLLRLMGEQGMLVLCAFLTVPFLLPVSIPGVSTVFGLAIILVSLGIIMNRLPWMPRRMRAWNVDTEKLVPVLRKGAGAVRRLDAFVRPRLSVLVAGPAMARLNGLGLLLGGVLLLMPLGLIPFSNTLPAFAILFMAAAMSQRDGVFALLSYLTLVATMIYFGLLAWGALAAGRGLAGLLGG